MGVMESVRRIRSQILKIWDTVPFKDHLQLSFKTNINHFQDHLQALLKNVFIRLRGDSANLLTLFSEKYITYLLCISTSSYKYLAFLFATSTSLPFSFPEQLISSSHSRKQYFDHFKVGILSTTIFPSASRVTGPVFLFFNGGPLIRPNC